MFIFKMKSVSKDIISKGRQSTQMTSFAIAVVRNPFKQSHHFDKYLTIEESNGRGWWLAGGALHHGETFQQAALREVREEAGIEVELKGILRYMQIIGQADLDLPMGEARSSMVFYGEPKSIEQAENLKWEPDTESLQAAWFTLGELREMEAKKMLRFNEPVLYADYI